MRRGRSAGSSCRSRVSRVRGGGGDAARLEPGREAVAAQCAARRRSGGRRARDRRIQSPACRRHRDARRCRRGEGRFSGRDQRPAPRLARLPASVRRDPGGLGSCATHRGDRGGSRRAPRSGPAVSPPDAFPRPADVVRFIAACVAARRALQGDGGLASPAARGVSAHVRRRQPTWSDVRFPQRFPGRRLAWSRASTPPWPPGFSKSRLPASLRLNNGAIEWRGQRFGKSDIERARSTGIAAFGSCSFTEPIGDLTALGFL